MIKKTLSNPRAAAAGVLMNTWLLTAPASFALEEASGKHTPGVIDIIETETGPVQIEHLATLTEPWGMEFLPDGRLLVTEKPGRLRVYAEGALLAPIEGVPKVEYLGQGGLLDVTVDPKFADNRFIYLYFTEKAPQQPADPQVTSDPRLGPFINKKDDVLKGGAVARAELASARLTNIKIIWRQHPKTVGLGHFGGRLAFAPDGTLFITSGERQRFEPAQDTRSNLGTIVRINADGSIPKDNPFRNNNDARPDIWSYGHRNQLGAAIHPTSGTLWTHEMGPWHGDELNITDAEDNYGWPEVSNGKNYDGSHIPHHATKLETFTRPIHYWHPAISPSGLIFYSGARFPDWNGNALIGGLSSQALLRLTLDGDVVKNEERISMNRRIRDVAVSPDGDVLVLTDDKEAALLRLTPKTSR